MHQGGSAVPDIASSACLARRARQAERKPRHPLQPRTGLGHQQPGQVVADAHRRARAVHNRCREGQQTSPRREQLTQRATHTDLTAHTRTTAAHSGAVTEGPVSRHALKPEDPEWTPGVPPSGTHPEERVSRKRPTQLQGAETVSPSRKVGHESVERLIPAVAPFAGLMGATAGRRGIR
jgi:hypothetical protein